MIDSDAFPRLTPTNHRITSSSSPDYNCVAWAVGDTEHWWQPGEYWPIVVPGESASITHLVTAFAKLGFESIADSSLEPGYEKIALFESASYFTHVARQTETGKWTSKLGREEDIEHDSPDDLAGGV